MVSSLILVRLPFPVPDPLSEAEREQYPTLQEYIQAVIVPEMQKSCGRDSDGPFVLKRIPVSSVFWITGLFPAGGIIRLCWMLCQPCL